jgi:hypothetical protein
MATLETNLAKLRGESAGLSSNVITDKQSKKVATKIFKNDNRTLEIKGFAIYA